MSNLETVAQHRDAILLAELAGLLHNIGKLNPNFLKSTVSDEGKAVELLKQHSQFVDGYAFKRFAKPSENILDPSVKTYLANNAKLDPNQLSHTFINEVENPQKQAAKTFNNFYRGVGPLNNTQVQLFLPLLLEVSGEKWQLTDLLTLFWDDFFNKPNNNDYLRTYALDPWLSNRPNGLPNLLIQAHGEISGSEKYRLTEQEDTGVMSTEDVTQAKSSFANLRIATAFGYEIAIPIWNLQRRQQNLINRVPKLSLNDGKWHLRIKATLRNGLGDTQRPINEITLWDYASSIAALFKTSIAKSFLEGQVADANQMHWRLLGVRFDGLDYLLEADRIADILGRQQQYQKALNRVCLSLTQEAPIASQVYQDESGLFFVVPDSDKLKLEDVQSLIKKQLQEVKFGDLRPQVDWSENPLRGKQLNLGKEIKRQDKVPRPPINPETMIRWWQNSSTQICEVCGLRPAISKKTKYCTTCQTNRQSRIKAWLGNANSTIWLDEVADSNGRLALITGQFPLNQWLDGTLIESLALGIDKGTGKPVSKFASFPRVQRIWQTTQTFWQEAQTNITRTLSDARRRLQLTLANAPRLTAHQTYELDLLGQTRMSVLWDGSQLLTIDNLSYIAAQLGFPLQNPQTRATKSPEDLALDVGTWLEQHQEKKPGHKQVFQLISDDEKNQRFDIQIAGIDYQDAAYTPAIPILAQPRTFMTLVPAHKALDIAAAIQTKYEREMGKVRNRLPLHLGIVYFQRRTPLRAALDAGRRMLNYELGIRKDEVWTVQEVGCLRRDELPEALVKDTKQFHLTVAVKLEQHGRFLTWHIPAKMGDGTTPDNWYPYVFISNRDGTFKAPRPTNNGSPQECWLIHASQLQTGDKIYFTPATLDFQWLDNAGRRFEIAYDKNGRRRHHPTRPYLLDELDTLKKAWNLISGTNGLHSSQIYALRDLIESKRESWQPTTEQCAETDMFWQFCRHAVVNANWAAKPSPEKIDQLTSWVISGLFTDMIQLYMGIMKQKPQREENTNE